MASERSSAELQVTSFGQSPLSGHADADCIGIDRAAAVNCTLQLESASSSAPLTAGGFELSKQPPVRRKTFAKTMTRLVHINLHRNSLRSENRRLRYCSLSLCSQRCHGLAG